VNKALEAKNIEEEENDESTHHLGLRGCRSSLTRQ